jgi:hypothetical protein
METNGLSAIVELLDKITTIGILIAAWLWERKERTLITNMYIQDMRRFARRGRPLIDDDEIEDSPVSLNGRG